MSPNLFANFHCPIRHLILLLSTLCMMLIFSNSILLNFTIICMRPPASADGQHDDNQTWNNSTNSSLKSNDGGHNTFSPIQRSALFSATAIGAILGGFPLNRLVTRFTLRKAITAYGLLSAFATLATPLGYAWFGFPALLLARIFQGTAFPAEYVTISSVTRKWAPLSSAGTFLLLISSHFQLGPMCTMPAAGHFCESPWGWQAIYYIQGILTLISFLFFYVIFRDTPRQHQWVSDVELKEIEYGQTESAERTAGKIPYREILSDWAVWVMFGAFFSEELGFQIYTQLGPYYLNKVLGISVASTGLFSALPFLVSLVSKVVTGPINDRLLSKCLNEHGRIKLFAGISQYGIASSLACLAFLPLVTNSLVIILPFYATLNMFTGLDFLGIFRCTQTISLGHSEELVMWESTISSCVALVLPAIVNALAPDDSLEQWMRVLGAIALIVAICITNFMLFGQTRPRKWAIESEEDCRRASEGGQLPN